MVRPPPSCPRLPYPTPFRSDIDRERDSPWASLVVGFSAADGAGPVQLFGEHETRELVRQRPRRERQPAMRTLPYHVADAVGPARSEEHTSELSHVNTSYAVL